MMMCNRHLEVQEPKGRFIKTSEEILTTSLEILISTIL